MTSPTWFFDGVRRRIYEVPPGASFTTDVDGYRIYDGGPSSPAVMSVDVKKDNWSRWTDWHALHDWALLAFSVSGGSQRPTGEFAPADFSLRTSVGWRYVLADYPHETIFYGNLFPEGADSLFDFSRMTSVGVVPRLQGSANLLTYSYSSNGSSAGGITQDQFDLLMAAILSRSSLTLTNLSAARQDGNAVVTEVLSASATITSPLTAE